MKLKDKQFKTVQVKGGKQYVEVKERLEYLSKEFEGEYSINTDYQFFEAAKIWVVKATLTLVQEGKINTYTGLGQEKEGGTGVNFTSALENAETSAVGRACAMAGIGIDISIASADEMNKALNKQNKPVETPPVQAQPSTPPKQESEPEVKPEPITDDLKQQVLKLIESPFISPVFRESTQKNIDSWTSEDAKATIKSISERIGDKEKLPVTEQQKEKLLNLLGELKHQTSIHKTQVARIENLKNQKEAYALLSEYTALVRNLPVTK